MRNITRVLTNIKKVTKAENKETLTDESKIYKKDILWEKNSRKIFRGGEVQYTTGGEVPYIGRKTFWDKYESFSKKKEEANYESKNINNLFKILSYINHKSQIV